MMKTTLERIVRHGAWFLLSASASFMILTGASPSEGGYSVIKKIPIPGRGSWDYLTVDESARRLYISHGIQVEVLDVDSGAIVGKIENMPGVHGIAIAGDVGRGFVSDGQSSTVTVFDLKTLKTIAGVPAGKSRTRSFMIRRVTGSSLLMATATVLP